MSKYLIVIILFGYYTTSQVIQYYVFLTEHKTRGAMLVINKVTSSFCGIKQIYVGTMFFTNATGFQ